MTGTLQSWKNLVHFHRFRLYAKARRSVLPKRVFALVGQTDIGPMAVSIDDMEVSRRLLRDGSWEQVEIDRILKLTGEQDRVLIVGGHIGSLAIPIARHCAEMKVIEANPETFRLLSINLLLNRSENVEALNFAANDDGGSLRFLNSRINSGGAKREPKVSQYGYTYDNPEVIEVPAVVLDKEFAGQTFDTIIMDIEGSEYYALKGAQQLLASSRMLIVEFLPHHLQYVASVSAEEFANLIAPHFGAMYAPSTGRVTQREDIASVLKQMYEADIEEDGLFFVKDPVQLDLIR